MTQQRASLRLVAAHLAVLVLAGCASQSHRAPVEERVPTPRVITAPAVAPKPVVQMNTENAGKPGYYTVKPGDTLIRISLEVNQTWRDLMKWNNLENPDVIEVGQVLRVAAPGQEAAGPTIKPIATPKAEPRTVDAKASDAKPGVSASAPPVPAPVASAAPAAAGATPAPAGASVRDGDAEPAWTWPAAGAIIGNFEEGKNKGVAIGGKAGDPVLAAADGKVVYAGSAMYGYGNLIIIKHNATYLSAYAHNQALLVKEEQWVKRGQKIAEMGSTEADRVQLHFEIRRVGRAVDPLKLLPPR